MKGFNDVKFIDYVLEKNEGYSNYYLRTTLENILQYAHRYEHIIKGQFVYFLYDLIPELDVAEIAQFADDDILTNTLILEKQEFLREQKQ
jgi:hypothetical protein